MGKYFPSVYSQITSSKMCITEVVAIEDRNYTWNPTEMP